MSSKPDTTGLVLRVDAKLCHVDVDGTVHQVPIRGRLFEVRGWEKNPVAVGDHVRLHLDDEGGAIEEVLPRTTKLARRSKGEEDREQVLAANVSLVLIASSTREPPLQPLLVDRILAGAERQDIHAAVVFTKVDRDRKGHIGEWTELYRGLGYEVFETSVKPGAETVDTLEQVRGLMARNVTVICGLSGVGKSTLINWLVPGLELRIGSISRIRQGKHTTTHTQLIPLPFGGHVLDTPGIRNFGLFGVAAQEIAFYFRDIKQHAQQCSYRTCTHIAEPDCAVRDAVEAGAIHPSRYESYVRILDDIERDERRTPRS